VAKKAHRTIRALGERQARRRRDKRVDATVDEEAQSRKRDDEGFLFDPYWDDVFGAYFDPTLRTCCLLKY